MHSEPAVSDNMLLIFGPAAWAARTAQLLQSALSGTLIRTCTDIEALARLLDEHRNAMVVARVAAGTPTAALAAIPRRAEAPRLVLAAAPDVTANALLGLMSAGVAGLVREDDGAALTAALRRAATTADATARGADSSALGTLADRIQQPLALVRDGAVVHANPRLCRLLGLADPAAVCGRPLADFAVPEAAGALTALLARALLLDLDEETGETLDFLPLNGPAFSAEVSAAPLDVDSDQGLAVTLMPVPAGIADAATRATTADCGRLLQRLAVLTDDASPVERSSALALAIVRGYGEHRRSLGFAGAASLLRSLADCLADAAPAQSSVFVIADDSVAVLVEGLSGAELDPLRRRLAAAPAAATDDGLRDLGLSIGIARVAPGAGAPQDLLDAALADAPPDRYTAPEPVGQDTTEGLDLLAPVYSLEPQQASTLSPALRPVSEATPPAAPSARTASPSPGAAPQHGSPGLDAAREAALTDDLDGCVQRALNSQGFQLALQPIVSLMGDSREHYSVLLRLRRADGRLASAEQILASDAARGRMAEIDRWVIRSALRLLGQRRRIGERTAFFLSLSPEMVADAQLLIWLCDALREFEVRGSWLTFQMREQDALEQTERWADLAAGLREIRCRIGLSQCQHTDTADASARVEPDFIKSAPSLATGLASDRHKQHRLLELIRAARSRHARTIVTGVEDSRSLNLLWDAGIEYVQGNHLQAPASALDLPLGAEPDVNVRRLSLHF
jgi:EAL domain-containing protein (putative c-di-GMP-specific phosphodiesterase class I)/PAS domain-containing protein